jgi:hypothetical protein
VAEADGVRRDQPGADRGRERRGRGEASRPDDLVERARLVAGRDQQQRLRRRGQLAQPAGERVLEPGAAG